MYARLLVSLFILVALISRLHAATIFVDINVGGGGDDGTSWGDAYNGLFEALAAAGDGDELWVARGNYIEGATIVMVDGVDMYGGFTNGMATLGERNAAAHPTQIDGNGAYRVIEGADDAILDGFIITNGAATRGGGMENNGESPILINCTFVDNQATTSAGGAMANFNSKLTARNCTFANNRSSGSLGGGIYIAGALGNEIYSNCFFVGNSAEVSNGGAIHNVSAALTVRDSVFSKNHAFVDGGAIFSGGSTLLEDIAFLGNRASRVGGLNRGGAVYFGSTSAGVVQHCTFAGNRTLSSASGGAIYDQSAGSPTIYRNCVFSDNRAEATSSVSYGGAINFHPTKPSTRLVQKCVFAGNESGNHGGALECHNANLDLSIENSLFAGNRTKLDGGAIRVLSTSGDTRTRILHSTFAANRTTGSAGDGGAIYEDLNEESTIVSNSVFWGNSASGNDDQIRDNNTTLKLGLGHSLIQDGVPPNVNDDGGNTTNDPAFIGGASGTWSSVSPYDDCYAETMLTDAGAGWSINAHQGLTVNPDTNQWLQFVIASNSTDTLYVYGNARTNLAGAAIADAGDDYRINNYRISTGSPAIDGGQDVGVAEDYDGTYRPQILNPDMGAFEFRITNDSTPPGNVTGLSATGGQAQVVLAWTNPVDGDFVGVLVLRREGAMPTGVPQTSNNTYSAGGVLGDAVIAYYGTGTDNTPGAASGWTDTSAVLQDETTYFYKVFARDGVPNFSVTPPFASATTEVDTTPPDPVDGLAVTTEDTQVNLFWNNPPQPDFAGVLIVRKVGSAYDGTPPTDGIVYGVGSLIGDGVVVYVGTGSDSTPGAASWWQDTQLTNDLSYFYRVFAPDEVPNYSTGVDTNAIPELKNVVYVDRDALGANNGSSWANAYSNLSVALGAVTAPTKLWIAEGIYYPGTIRANTFQLVDGVSLFGGFAGNETAIHQRNVAGQPTILSGDIDEDDLLDDDNSHHVVTGGDDIQLDGLTIAMGYTLDITSHPDGDGAGLLFPADTLVSGRIDNCTFEYNSAYMRGGAIYLDYQNDGRTGLTISNSVFRYNTLRRDHSSAEGGAIYIFLDRPLTIQDSVFSDNGGGQTYNAGAIMANRADLHLFNTTFARNTCERLGGAIYGTQSTPVAPYEIIGCDFFENENTALVDGGAIYVDRGHFEGNVIRDCRFYANRSIRDAGAVMLRNYRGLVEDTVFSCNTAGANAGALYHYRSQIDYNRVIFTGNSAIDAGAFYAVDSAGQPGIITMTNVLAAGNHARGIGGMMRIASSDSTIRYSTFVDNRQSPDTSTHDGGGALNIAEGLHEIESCILYGNRADDPGDQIYLYDDPTITLKNTIIEGDIEGIEDEDSLATIINDGSTDIDPVFNPPYSFGRSGTWTANASYTNATGMAVLTDTNAAWAEGMLAGMILNPNTNAGNLACFIAANTKTTITILGGDTNCLAGDPYQILEYSLQWNSLLKDVATAPTPADDLAGTSRPQGGGPDLGAYEVPNDTTDPSDVTGLDSVASLDTVTLTWTNPSDADFRGVFILRREGAVAFGDPNDTSIYALGNTIGDAEVVYIGDGGNLEPGGAAMWGDTPRDHLTTYSYKVCAFDRVPNYASGATTTATTPLDDDTPDPVTDVRASGFEDDAILTWINSVSADFAGVLILRRSGSSSPTGTPTDSTSYTAGNVIGNGQVVYVGPGNDANPGAASGWTETGIGQFSRYSYCVFAYDEVPLYAAADCDDTITGKANTWFVNDDAAGYENGRNWDDAFLDLQDAIRAASGGDAIWIAAGAYYPTNGTDRDVYFNLKANVALYGGFSGSESSTDSRDWTLNESILSGDIGSQPLQTDNSKQIAEVDGASGVVLDGLYFERAQGEQIGAALTTDSDTTVRNCTFRYNHSTQAAGVQNNGSGATYHNCIFHDNTASSRAGAFQAYFQPVTLVNCLFYKNQSPLGGAINAYHNIMTLRHCTFADNLSPRAAAVYISNFGSLLAHNCIFWDQDAHPLDHGGGISLKQQTEGLPNWASDGQVHYSIVRGTNSPPFNPPAHGSGSNNMTNNPAFENAPGFDYHLTAPSPAIDAGVVLGSVIDDLDGNDRPLRDGYDMGVYEFGLPVNEEAMFFMIK